MGTTQITAAMLEASQKLNLERFKVIGFHKNSSADDLVTDSAAGATAFSIGKKANNGNVGVDANEDPHETIMETAIKEGLTTALVATSTIVHATPASFAAHWPKRRDYEVIAEQMSRSEVDLMVGGGLKFFNRREDEVNLIEAMMNKGYKCTSFFDTDLEELNFDPGSKHLHLTADDSPIPVAQGRDYLPVVSKKALSYVSERGEEKGFFIMIEGSQIDWGGHANQFDYVVSELHEFDKVVGAALDFAEQDGETLVLVTADHETGGLTILKGSKPGELKANFADDYHTAELIPVFAYGPGAEQFGGIYENTEIYFKLRSVLGW
jgi:alkaline phosphatase